MRLLLQILIFALTATGAVAQSSPNWSYGQVPTAGQFNAAFATKQDVLTFVPLNRAGGTMMGKLSTYPSTINNAGFAILPGVAPTNPSNGDLWIVGNGLFAQLGNQTTGIAPLISPTFTGTVTIPTLAITGPGLTTSRDGSVLLNPTSVPAFGVTGQGAPTTVSNYLFPNAVDGRHFAIVGQINSGATAAGDKVGVFGGAESGSGSSDIWGGNFLAQWNSGSPDINVQGVEIDFNNQNHDVDASQSKLRTGLNVTSGGTYHPNVGAFIGSTTTANSWRNGLYIGATSFTNAGLNVGGNPAYTGAIVAPQPYGTTGDTIVMHRSTDTAPGGYFLRGVTQQNTASLFTLDVSGNFAIGLNPATGSPLSVTQQTASASTAAAAFTGLAVENNASANSTAKTAQVAFYGRDTAASLKQSAAMASVPEDANWVNGAVVLYNRRSDSVVEAIRVTSAGHVAYSGPTPTLTSCGTSPSVVGTDNGGRVTVGSAATGCQINFAANWVANPFCVVTSQAGTNFSYSYNGAAINIVNIGNLSSSVVDYRCEG